ncbi:MAG: hypothetical protein M3N23_03510 [Pseudomonadota bacterium]|nr:hypothetical protein [Pseudomonadota bacterium]
MSRFSPKGEARQLHYRATYQLDGKPHTLEVWRDRDLQLKRRTDDALETILSRPAAAAEWQMTVLDLKRHIRTDISHTNLARIGHFTDWFSQSHSLTRPIGSYQLTRIPAPAIDKPALERCQWYRLQQQERASAICWSEKLKLPLLIADADSHVQWRVVAADRQPFAATQFHIDDRGFAKNDANEDIQAD